MSGILMEYTANLYDAVISIWLIAKLNGKKVRGSKLSYLAILVFFIVTNLFTHFSPDSSIVQCIAHIATHYLYIFLLLRKQEKRIIGMLSPIIFQIVMACGNLLIIFSLNRFFSISISDLVLNPTMGRLVLMLSSKVILTSVVIIIAKTLHPTEKRFTLFDLVGYLIFPIVTILHMELYYQFGMKYNMVEFSGFFVFSILSLSAINVLMFVLFNRTIQNTSAKHELELLNSRSELEEKRYSELGNMYRELQITRHDLKDHLVYIDNLIAEKRYDEVERYISDRRQELDSTRRVQHTGNRVLDYIINSKLENAKDISFIITGELRELKGVDDLDIASLFGNILDNAIEGTKGSSAPSITLEFSITGNYQNILCKNSIAASVLKDNPKLHTTKRDHHRHGYGVQSIRRIVAKHGGMVEFYEEDGMFCVHVALNC
ncbi:MAG: GHKL domain-containing protein [Clostridia bacterium]|nr:GHKL domain-containing protein [Clostridia bacterium]